MSRDPQTLTLARAAQRAAEAVDPDTLAVACVGPHDASEF